MITHLYCDTVCFVESSDMNTPFFFVHIISILSYLYRRRFASYDSRSRGMERRRE